MSIDCLSAHALFLDSKMEQVIYSVEKVDVAILESLPPQLQIVARGQVVSSGWKNPRLVPHIYIQPPPDGIYDYTFVADPPDGTIVTPALEEIVANTIIQNIPKGLKGVRVRAATNEIVSLISKAAITPTNSVGLLDDTVVVTGDSFTLSFNEALVNAISKIPPSPIADGQTSFKVLNVEGVLGGFAGLQKLTVTLAATIQT